MTYVDIKIDGLKQVLNDFKDLAPKILDAAESGLDESARLALEVMRRNTPVDTGNLRASEKVKEKAPLRRVIGPDLEKASYGVYVELGHATRGGSFIPGQFYIERTSIEIRPIVKQIINKYISNAIQKG